MKIDRKFGLIVFFIMLIWFCPVGIARTFAFGKVVDSYTRELLNDCQVDLMRPDSTLIKTYFTHDGINAFNQPMNLSIDSIPQSDVILRVTADGYYPTIKTIKQPGIQERSVEIAPIMMNRIPFHRPRELNEVTVTASRVKMVVKGDTITYNADAFALAQGSMLDGLIDMLPGAKLQSDGKIYVNGKFVNELLVNGDNFFKGDPKIALENLPAYMVNKIQVYHRNEKMEKKPLEELPLVMDVKLKKQYQTGWIANAEGGYGTSDRYLARLFAMMFTRDSRLSVVGNINNTNDDRKPGQTDNWNPNWQSAGRATIASAGIDYLWNSRLRNWKVEADMMARHKKSDITSDGSSERYLSGGNLFGKQGNSQFSREWRVTTDNKVTFHVPRLWLYLTPTARFEREKANFGNSSSTSDSYGELLNSLDENSNSFKRLWSVSADLDGRWTLPRRPDDLTFGAALKWSDRRFETAANRRLLFPFQPEENDFSRRLEFMPERKQELKGNVGYGINYSTSRFFQGVVKFNYSFNHQHINCTRDYFLMPDSDGLLPSVTDAVVKARFVASNSYDYTLDDDDHAVNVSLTNWFPHLKRGKYQPNFCASVNLHYSPGSITYLQAETTHYADRRKWYAEPELRFSIDDIGTFSYKYKATLPQLRDLLDVTDAANPLYIFCGNPALKTTRMHEVWIMIWHIFKKGPMFDFSYRKYENLVAQSADYDMLTGVTTYKPVNVNDNWEIASNLRHYGKMGRSDKLWLESTTKFFYQNSVDVISSDLNTVRNLNLGENLKLTYKIMSGMEVSANGNGEWRQVTSPTDGFESFSAVDFDYGVIFRATKLPWDMSFTSDLMMHSRRGYSDSRLNSNDLVWNARIAKSIMHGNLTFALDGFDILGNLSNVRLTLNSQGRTEMRYNTLPRYAMLHILYRLNLEPRKR